MELLWDGNPPSKKKDMTVDPLEILGDGDGVPPVWTDRHPQVEHYLSSHYVHGR